jgi:dihydrofolate reductase
MKAIIVAMDKNRGIGAHNDLLWQRDLPADLAHFKKLTTGKSIIMGRKTFESIGRSLPNRQNIIVSRQGALGVAGTMTAASLTSAYALAQFDIFVIGGGELYAQAIDDVDTLYVTHVDASFSEATTFFPQIDHEEWQEVSRSHHESDDLNKYAFDFVTYKRVV